MVAWRSAGGPRTRRGEGDGEEASSSRTLEAPAEAPTLGRRSRAASRCRCRRARPTGRRKQLSLSFARGGLARLCLGLDGAGSRRDGQPADHERRDQEHAQRDHVLRVRDREPVTRLDEEEVERKHAEHGGAERRDLAAADRHEQHREQVDDAQAGGGGERVEQPTTPVATTTAPTNRRGLSVGRGPGPRVASFPSSLGPSPHGTGHAWCFNRPGDEQALHRKTRARDGYRRDAYVTIERRVGAPRLFATAYSTVGSSIYFALGVVAAYALGLTPLVFLIASLLFVLTTLTYFEGMTLYPERGGSAVMARYALQRADQLHRRLGDPARLPDPDRDQRALDRPLPDRVLVRARRRRGSTS